MTWSRRLRRSPRTASRLTLLGQTSTRTDTTSRRSAGSPRSRPAGTWAATCRSTRRPDRRHCCGPSTGSATDPGARASRDSGSSLPPWDLSERLVAAIADCPSVCEHLHLPVQAGDDTVLRRMGRQYTVAAYLELVDRLRSAVPDIALTTDVIVGFCGETEAQFESTLALLDQVRFDGVFAAAFSPRPGTPAARMPDDVPAAVKRRRLNTLLALQEGIGLERNRAWVGQPSEVLVDQVRPARSHDHDAPEAPPANRGWPAADRHNKLAHLDGGPDLVGSPRDGHGSSTRAVRAPGAGAGGFRRA